jgi:hypothetical protein
MTSNLGGGIRGVQPKLVGGGANSNSGSGMIGSGMRGIDRLVLREGFGNSGWLKQIVGASNVTPNITPFRLAMNAGDINGSVNSAPIPQLPSVNQINGQSQSKLRANGGGAKNDGEAAFSGNPRYVYDGSDYVRFKKLKAVNRTYNDSSFGGDQSNASFTFINRVRR